MANTYADANQTAFETLITWLAVRLSPEEREQVLNVFRQRIEEATA